MIVDNINNGVAINELFRKWNSIETQEQHDAFCKEVSILRFGLKNIIEVIDNFNPIDSFLCIAFKKECLECLKKQSQRFR